jgi:hypothetical protein
VEVGELQAAGRQRVDVGVSMSEPKHPSCAKPVSSSSTTTTLGGGFLDRHAHLFEIPASGQGALEVRIDRFASSRTALWDAIGPMARLGRARSFEHPGLADLLLGARLAQADQVRQQFAPELEALAPQAQADAVAVIVSLTAFEAWDLQRRDLGRTPAQIRRAWRTALRALLTPPADPRRTEP